MPSIVRYDTLKIATVYPDQHTHYFHCAFPYIYGKYSRVTVNYSATAFWSSTVQESPMEFFDIGPSFTNNMTTSYRFGTRYESYYIDDITASPTGHMDRIRAYWPYAGYDNRIICDWSIDPAYTQYYKPYGGDCHRTLVMDQYNDGTYKTHFTQTFDTSTGATDTYNHEASTADSNDYADATLYPAWRANAGGNPYVDDFYVSDISLVSGSNVELVNGYFGMFFKMQYAGTDWVKINNVRFENYNPSTGQYEIFDEYEPCLCDNSTGFINTLDNIFVPLEGDIFDEYPHEVFPNANVTATNRLRYNNGESPVEAFRVFKTLEALQAFIAANRVHVGELISIVDDNSNNGVYQIIYGASNALTYRKLKFK